MIHCNSCDLDLPDDKFGMVNSRGKKVKRKQCRKCYRNRIRQKELTNPSALLQRRLYQNQSQSKSRHTPIGWCKYVARRIKSKCKKYGIPFNITHRDILNVYPTDGKCPVFGSLLVLDEHSQNNASVDRLNSKLGYVTGNIVVISAKANAIKNNATADEIMAVARWLERVIKD